MIRTAAFLRNVPMLAGLSDELLERLAGEVQEVGVRAGGWILREGEAADSVFIVRSGRVEVVDEGPPEALIRILRRGDVLGELALLREGTRSMSARARRDVELFELGRAPFEALIQDAPSFALGLTRAFLTQWLPGSRHLSVRLSTEFCELVNNTRERLGGVELARSCVIRSSRHTYPPSASDHSLQPPHRYPPRETPAFGALRARWISRFPTSRSRGSFACSRRRLSRRQNRRRPS